MTFLHPGVNFGGDLLRERVKTNAGAPSCWCVMPQPARQPRCRQRSRACSAGPSLSHLHPFRRKLWHEQTLGRHCRLHLPHALPGTARSRGNSHPRVSLGTAMRGGDALQGAPRSRIVVHLERAGDEHAAGQPAHHGRDGVGTPEPAPMRARWPTGARGRRRGRTLVLHGRGHPLHRV